MIVSTLYLSRMKHVPSFHDQLFGLGSVLEGDNDWILGTCDHQCMEGLFCINVIVREGLRRCISFGSERRWNQSSLLFDNLFADALLLCVFNVHFLAVTILIAISVLNFL